MCGLNYENFDHSVVEFLNEYMLRATKEFDYSQGQKIFTDTFKALSNLENGITRNRTTTPTNLFEGVAVGAALALNQTGQLVLADTTWMSGETLKGYTTGATNSRTKVTQRIEFCRDKFLGL